MNMSLKKYFNPNEILNSSKSHNIVEESLLINNLFYFMFENRQNYNIQFKNQKKLTDDIDEFIFSFEKNQEKKIQNNDCENSTKEILIEKGSEVMILKNESNIFPNSIPYLYYESIPNILSDFIFKNYDLFIIDKNDEFKSFVNVLII